MKAMASQLPPSLANKAVALSSVSAAKANGPRIAGTRAPNPPTGLGHSRVDLNALNRHRGDDEDRHGGSLAYLGPNSIQNIHMFLGFHIVGHGFSEGAKSLREISSALDESMRRGKDLDGFPTSARALSESCRVAESFFRRHFNSSSGNPLLLFETAGQVITGLTDLGVAAWALVHDYLVYGGLIREDD
jgi:hypothetical protein